MAKYEPDGCHHIRRRIDRALHCRVLNRTSSDNPNLEDALVVVGKEAVGVETTSVSAISNSTNNPDKRTFLLPTHPKLERAIHPPFAIITVLASRDQKQAKLTRQSRYRSAHRPSSFTAVSLFCRPVSKKIHSHLDNPPFLCEELTGCRRSSV